MVWKGHEIAGADFEFFTVNLGDTTP